jgi:hypothetical protein
MLDFVLAEDGVVHGFVALANCELDGEVSLGRAFAADPESFLPLTDPVRVRKGERLRVAVERKSTGAVGWFEWAVMAPDVSRLENRDGAFNTFPIDNPET